MSVSCGIGRVYRGIRNQTSGSHSSRAYGTGRSSIEHLGARRGADDVEEIAQPDGVARTETGAVAQPAPGADLAEFGRAARQLERAREVGHVERAETPA